MLAQAGGQGVQQARGAVAQGLDQESWVAQVGRVCRQAGNSGERGQQGAYCGEADGLMKQRGGCREEPAGTDSKTALPAPLRTPTPTQHQPTAAPTCLVR